MRQRKVAAGVDDRIASAHAVEEVAEGQIRSDNYSGKVNRRKPAHHLDY